MLITLLAVLAPALSAPDLQTAALSAPPQSPPPTVLRVRPVRELIEMPKRPVPPPMSPLLGSAEEQTSEFQPLLDSSDGLRIAESELSDLLDARLLTLGLGDQRYESEWSVSNGLATIRGTPEVVRRADELFDHLRGALHPAIDVEVKLLRFAAGSTVEPPEYQPRGVLAADVRPAVPDAQTAWSARARTRAGAPIGLGAGTRTPFVRSFHVEVAQRADTAGIDVQTFFEGVDVVVEPHTLAGSDDLVVYVQGAVAKRRADVVVRASGLRDYPSVDVPTLAVANFATGARVAPGESIAVWSLGAEAGGDALCLVVTCKRAAPAPQLDGLAVLDISSLIAPRLGVRVAARDDEDWQRFGTPFELRISEALDGTLGGLDRDSVRALVAQALEPWTDEGTARVELVGASIAVFGPAAAIARVREVLGGVEDALHRTVELRARTLLSDGAGGDRLHLLVMPGLAGRAHVAIRGIESLALMTFEPEIAQRATSQSPVVRTTFTGIIASWLPWQLDDSGRNGCDAVVDVIHTAAPRRRPTDLPEGGDLWFGEVKRARFSHCGELPVGKALVLGRGFDLDVDGRRTTIEQALQVQ
ncbi:MAG: hypothetical protein IPM29_19155 [Planctomycetes bacterium]|nr:hypothetical protein [Planctomycetota bacterium]